MRDTTRQRKKLYHEFRGICFYCEKRVTFDDSTRDHFWPLSRRGWNGINNLVLSCSKCNCVKSNELPTLADYFRLLALRPNLHIDNLHEPPIEQLPPELREAFRERDRIRARKATQGAEKVAAHKAFAENRRLYLLYSNMAGPTFACASVSGGCVRAHRTKTFPFQAIEFLPIQPYGLFSYQS